MRGALFPEGQSSRLPCAEYETFVHEKTPMFGNIS
jgi:hypothetical protein